MGSVECATIAPSPTNAERPQTNTINTRGMKRWSITEVSLMGCRGVGCWGRSSKMVEMTAAATVTPAAATTRLRQQAMTVTATATQITTRIATPTPTPSTRMLFFDGTACTVPS